MTAAWFFERMASWGDAPALVWESKKSNYAELLTLEARWSQELGERGIGEGSVVAIEGSFSPNACAALLALVRLGAVAVPLTPLMRAHRDKFLDIAEAQLTIELDANDGYQLLSHPRPVTNAVTLKLLERRHPGLVIFSSGSSGAPKAILHDFAVILEKFRQVRQKKTTLTFLLFDHIGGIDTLLNTFGSGGTVVTVPNRDPETVCRTIAKHRVHTLPASPTFLNLLLMSGAWAEHDLSSLRVIAYGTEPMPPATLKKLHELLPNVALVQT